MSEKNAEQIKQELNVLRIKEKELKAQAEKLGPITHPVTAEDLEIMYAGKLADMLMEQKVRASNILNAYHRTYPDVTPVIENELWNMWVEMEGDFARSKRRMMKSIEKHPMWEKVGFIKGFSSYMMALLMSYIKDISRFDTPGQLCVYAGISSIGPYAIAKRNLTEIKEYYAKQGKEFKGFNTRMAGRLHVLADSFFRSRGYFHNYYLGIKERLIKRALNNDETELRAVDKVPIMKGKNNQPLKAWAHANAQRRMLRTFLHIFWTEWRLLNKLEVRNPYPIDYLGHKDQITLDDVLKYEEAQKLAPKKKKD